MFADFVYGLHWAPHEYFVGDRMDRFVKEMTGMGMGLVVTQNKDEYSFRKFKTANIKPIFRPMLYLTELYQDLSGVAAMIAAGVEPDVQIYNEWSDSREWPGGRPDNYVETAINRWIDGAIKVHNAGGNPGVQVLDPENELRPLLRAIKDRGLTFLFERIWSSVHAYPNSHDVLFPFGNRTYCQDGYNDDGTPKIVLNPDGTPKVATVYDKEGYSSIWVPLAFDKVYREELGHSVRTYITEGLWTVGDGDDSTYDRITPELHAKYTLELVKLFIAGKMANGEPWPWWLKGFVGWIIASSAMEGDFSFEASAWFDCQIRDEPNRTLLMTINALKQLSGGKLIIGGAGNTPVEPPTPDPIPDPTDPSPPNPAPTIKWRVSDSSGVQVGAYNSDSNALWKAVEVGGYVQPFDAPKLTIGAANVEVAQLRQELANTQAELRTAEDRITRAKEALA